MICIAEKEKLKLIKIREAQEILDVSRTTMYEMIHIKGFPLVKLGPKRFRVHKGRLERWIENNGRFV